MKEKKCCIWIEVGICGEGRGGSELKMIKKDVWGCLDWEVIYNLICENDLLKFLNDGILMR